MRKGAAGYTNGRRPDGERSGPNAGHEGHPGSARSQQRREGPEEERDRVRLQRRNRGGLDRARLQPRRDPGLRRRGSGPAGTGDPAGQLRADVPRRRRLLLHEQGRPRLRHELLLGDQGDGTAVGLDRRLDDRRRRRDRDGQPGADRRPLHLPPLRLDLGRVLDLRRDAGRGALDRADDRDRRDRHRALGPHAGRPARRRDLHPGALRRGGAGQGLRRQRPIGLDRPKLLVAQPVQPQPQRDLSRDAARRLHLLGLGHDGDRQRGDRGPQRGSRPGDRGQHADPARHLSGRGGGGPGLCRRRSTWSPTRKTC